MISYGLYVATSRDASGPAGGTVTWLSQSSFTPPLVMVAIKGDSALYRAISESGIFAIHIVGKGQQELATAFFKGSRASEDTLNGYKVRPGETGAPLLVDAAAWFECRVINKMGGGDHTVFLAELISAGAHSQREDERPLALRDTPFSYGG
jgi:flavin reductase (DIM6/NTAB) family NADH-FMN oxidoreductase RutF